MRVRYFLQEEANADKQGKRKIWSAVGGNGNQLSLGLSPLFFFLFGLHADAVCGERREPIDDLVAILYA
jgi:hypothetical protein